jgi:hypothetical protein
MPLRGLSVCLMAQDHPWETQASTTPPPTTRTGTDDDFENAQLGKGPGKQMCCVCEEFSEMFFKIGCNQMF